MRNQILCVILVSVVAVMSCSTAGKNEIKVLHHILLYNLHARRPVAVGALPSADPREYEYDSHPKPDASFDCQPVASLFHEIDATLLRKCLVNSIKLQNPKKISFLLKREAAPILKLEEFEEKPLPLCIRQLLGTLPVPREIFFQSSEMGPLSCYSSRLFLKSDRALEFMDFLYTSRVTVNLSTTHPPETDQEAVALLGTWAIRPFFSEDGKQLLSKLVASPICKQCLGEKNLFLEKDLLPPHWP